MINEISKRPLVPCLSSTSSCSCHFCNSKGIFWVIVLKETNVEYIWEVFRAEQAVRFRLDSRSIVSDWIDWEKKERAKTWVYLSIGKGCSTVEILFHGQKERLSTEWKIKWIILLSALIKIINNCSVEQANWIESI